jgi:hypothetical protein
MQKCLKVKYLCRIKYIFQKSCVTAPWDHKVSVPAKKVKKKFHAFVPLSDDAYDTSETDAGIILQQFYSILVLLVLVT